MCVQMYSARSILTHENYADLLKTIASMGYTADITRIRGTLGLWWEAGGRLLADCVGHGAASALGGHIVFGPEGGEFISPNTHKFKATPTTPLELRYELPGQTWSGYSRAPLRLGWVNDYNQFGIDGKVFVNVTKGTSQFPAHALEIPLIETTHENAFIHTNGFSFAAFGTSLAVGELSQKGDRFLWTDDHDGSLSPATPGSLPTGLVFDYAGRQSAFVIIVR